MNADGIDAGRLRREVRDKYRDVARWPRAPRCLQYHVSGRLGIRMERAEFIAGPGDVTTLSSGRDA